MKHAFLIITFFCLLPVISISQGRYATKKGEISFEASMPSFEEVRAKNSNVSAILNSDNGEFATLALVNGFRFKVALMEEHFNENYIESSKFPKTTFKGKIIDFDLSKLSKSETAFFVTGTITMHGIDKKLKVPALLTIEDTTIAMDLQFSLRPEDFNIKIPKIVSKKIANNIEVIATYKLKKSN
jgi:polyisoprenoid-binding protein YceI